MFIFGVTGSFGTGKTTVSKMFSRLGAEIIDADKIAHTVIKKNRVVFKRIVSLFGDGILDKNFRQISRHKLSKIVFDDKCLLRKLCKIIHPEVISDIKKQITIKKKMNCDVVVIDAPLLIEANLTSLVDRLIVVKANRETQINRIKEKMRLSKSEILKRTNSQISLKDKVKIADYVIDNNGSFGNTNRQVRDIWNKAIIKTRR